MVTEFCKGLNGNFAHFLDPNCWPHPFNLISLVCLFCNTNLFIFFVFFGSLAGGRSVVTLPTKKINKNTYRYVVYDDFGTKIKSNEIKKIKTKKTKIHFLSSASTLRSFPLPPRAAEIRPTGKKKTIYFSFFFHVSSFICFLFSLSLSLIFFCSPLLGRRSFLFIFCCCCCWSFSWPPPSLKLEKKRRK